MLIKTILLTQLASTLCMTGLIWFVQIVHYPLFSHVGEDGFAAYEAAHARRTGWVVAPLMLAELVTSILLAVHPPQGIPAFSVWIGLGLVGVIWLSTGLLQVPKHGILGNGFDSTAHRFLVGSNWVRTICWSGRAILVLWMAEQCMR